MKDKLIALGLAISVIIGFSGPSEAKSNCQKFYDKYLKAPGHKAFATTRGNDPGFDPTTCSMFAGFTFKNLAEKKAVADCNLHSRPEYGGHCRVISSK